MYTRNFKFIFLFCLLSFNNKYIYASPDKPSKNSNTNKISTVDVEILEKKVKSLRTYKENSINCINYILQRIYSTFNEGNVLEIWQARQYYFASNGEISNAVNFNSILSHYFQSDEEHLAWSVPKNSEINSKLNKKWSSTGWENICYKIDAQSNQLDKYFSNTFHYPNTNRILGVIFDGRIDDAELKNYLHKKKLMASKNHSNKSSNEAASHQTLHVPHLFGSNLLRNVFDLFSIYINKDKMNEYSKRNSIIDEKYRISLLKELASAYHFNEEIPDGYIERANWLSKLKTIIDTYIVGEKSDLYSERDLHLGNAPDPDIVPLPIQFSNLSSPNEEEQANFATAVAPRHSTGAAKNKSPENINALYRANLEAIYAVSLYSTFDSKYRIEMNYFTLINTHDLDDLVHSLIAIAKTAQAQKNHIHFEGEWGSLIQPFYGLAPYYK